MVKHVLVADDDPLIRWALARTVESLDMRALQAGTREEACGLLFARRFHAVVMSCSILEQDMTDVLRELDRYQPDTRLVVLCRGDCVDDLQARMPRAVVFQKPFPLDELRAALGVVRAANCNGGSPVVRI